jgi:hypothetical protein
MTAAAVAPATAVTDDTAKAIITPVFIYKNVR